MSVRCLITDGERYKENKLFVENILKYFPDYNFSIMKATISGWQSSQLKENEDRLPTIEELIDYLLNSAKKEKNDRLAIIANKANDILANDFNKEYQEILAKAPRDSKGRLLAPNGKVSNLIERQYAQVRTKAFKNWFGDWKNDPENASKVVDENGEPLVVYHGSKNNSFTIFDSTKNDKGQKGFFFTNDNIMASSYGKNPRGFFINSRNPYIIEGHNKNWNDLTVEVTDIAKDKLDSIRLFRNDLLLQLKEGKTSKEIYDYWNDKYFKLYDKYLSLSNSFIDKIKKIAILNRLNRFEGKGNFLKSTRYTERVLELDSEDTNIIFKSIKDYGPVFNEEATINMINNVAANVYVVTTPNQIKSAESNIGTFSTTSDNIYLEHEYNLENPKKDIKLEELSKKNKVTINDLVLLISLSEYNDIITVLKELSTGKEKLLKDIKVSVINPLDYYSKANEIRSKFNGGRAYYDANTNTIVIDASANFSNGDASSVILHEIMHHITVDRILSNPSLKEEFITLIKEYRKHYPNEYIGAIDNHYIEEFIADIWSNRTTIENLKKVEYKGKKHTTSLWDKILLFFKNKLFKGSVKDSMFELASNLLIDTINTNIKEYSKGTFYELQQSGQEGKLRKTYKGMITSLQDNQIFVFGSNTQGRHGAGAALIARQKFGAKYGLAEGFLGLSYAIITKDLIKDDKKNPSRTKELIIELIHKLYAFAKLNPNKEFLVAYSSTGKNLNYYSNKEMASMFASEQIPNNIVFEEGFNKLVNLQQTSQKEEKEINPLTISNKTLDFGVIIDSNLIRNYRTWLLNNPNGIVAYRVNKLEFNTPLMVEQGIIGNPFNWQLYGTGESLKIFYNWLINGNNYNEPLATEEFRQAIINKLLNTLTPNILYYKELNRPSHATILGYLITNKLLLKQSQSLSKTITTSLRVTQETPITTQQLNNTEDLDVEKAKATKDFLNPVTRRLTVLKLSRMFSNIVSREYDNFKLALDNRIANETDNKVKLELIFQRRKLSRYEVIKTLRPTTIFNRLKDTFLQYANLTEEQGIVLEKQLLNKNSTFQKMSDAVKTNIAKIRFEKKKKLYKFILDNFKILAMEASKGFALTEGVSLIFNEDSVVQTLEQDTYNEEGLSDVFENKEEKIKEGWMIEIRTVSSFSSLTNRIRQAINNIARVNKNGILEIDDTGDTIYLSGSYVHSELIKTLAPIITEPNDMIPILQKLAVSKPWVNLIINKLLEDPLLFTEMYRAYNKSTLNYWILKPRILQDGSIKTLTISINKIEGMDELFETWRDNYEYGNKLDNDTIYNSNGEIIKDNVKKGLDLINEVRQAIYYVRQDTRETRIATVLDKDNVRKITKAFKMLGINLEEETITEAILYHIEDTRYEPDSNVNSLVNALFTIYDDLIKNKDIKEGEQADLANLYGRALENVAKTINFVTESTMESQVRHNKKSLYAHVNSGYIINLIKKLKNPDKFKEFIEKEYMSVDWFYDKKTGKWRNQFLHNLYNNQEDRDKLSHIVMLDYNGKEYADWDTLDSTLVLFNLFRSLPTNDDNGWAYYNIPVLSDTESAEFLRMRRYIKDFRTVVNKKLVNLVLQEIDRIDLVKRRSQNPNVEKIANFDMVKTVDKNGVEHIKKGGAEFKFFPELNFLKINGKSFLDAYYENTSKMSNQQLNEWVALQIDNILANRFKKALTKWELIGLLDRVDDNPNGKFKYFETNSRSTAIAQLGEWYWNSTFAQSQIIELLTTDLAYYKTKGNDFLTDFIKRAKEFHAPIERLNTEAEWIVNGERKKVCYDDNGNLIKNRVLYLKDCEVPSLTLEDLKEALDKNPKLTLAEKNIIIGAYKSINMADALAYRTLDSFRRTLIMAGMWSDNEETAYNNIKNGNFRLEDITILWNTRKPYLYTLTNQSNQVDEGMIRVSTQHKNSEMVMLTLAVLGTIMSTGKLAALERFMTKNNIDAVMFESAVKTGGLDIINLNDIDASEVEDYLTNYVNNNSLAIHEFDYEDYGIQTATPEHGIDAMLLVGTQIRRIIASNQDMTDPNFRFKYGNKEWTVLEWQDLYNMINTANIKESFMRLDKKFSDIKEIEKLLLSEVRSNPRYDSDIELALALNNDGVFNIPLLDPSITYKILSLLTSIVKNRVTKQKIAGGAFIQTSAWGFKREPKVIYNDDGSVKHIECYIPCPSEELYNMLINEGTGEVDINKKYRGADGKEHYIVPEKYREFIGYRVPTESFYSCAPFKVIGFLPRQVGTIIVVPRDIVSMAGSDYDKP